MPAGLDEVIHSSKEDGRRVLRSRIRSVSQPPASFPRQCTVQRPSTPVVVSVISTEEALSLSSSEEDVNLNTTIVAVPCVSKIASECPSIPTSAVASLEMTVAGLLDQLQTRDKLLADMQREMARLTAHVCDLVQELASTRKELEVYRQGTKEVINLQHQAETKVLISHAKKGKRGGRRRGMKTSFDSTSPLECSQQQPLQLLNQIECPPPQQQWQQQQQYSQQQQQQKRLLRYTMSAA